MKLSEVTVMGGKQLRKARLIADKATKVIISGIDTMVDKGNMEDEYQYFRMVKRMVDERFSQILVKRHERAYKAAHSKR